MTNLKNLLRELFKIFDDLLSGERSLPFGLLVAYAKTKAQISFAVTGMGARFVSDLVGNPENRFSQNEAQIKGSRIFKMIVKT